jgi:hypothetical protein
MQSTLRTCGLVAGLASALACGSVRDGGHVQVVVQMLTASSSVTRVSLDISPAGISQDLTYTAATSSFTGTLAVPVGAQTLTAKAWAGANLVGTGTASVTVVKNQTTQATITVLDSTGPAPGPGHSPVITAFTAPATAMVGDVNSCSATAMDMDGDTITYAWSATPSGCATFANASAASTSVTAVTVGTCALAVVATATGGSDQRSGNLVISPATGTVQVNGTYVPQPRITQLELLDGTTVIWTIDRTGTDATFHTALTRNKAYSIRSHFDSVTDGALTLSSNCGAAFGQPPAITAATTVLTGTFTTPAAGAAACIVTATLTRQTLVDTFPVVLVIP